MPLDFLSDPGEADVDTWDPNLSTRVGSVSVAFSNGFSLTHGLRIYLFRLSDRHMILKIRVSQ
jgi:hypothetical protein